MRTNPAPATDEERRTLDALRVSLASDIVELVVLTADEAFLQTLRDAAGPSRRLWHVLSPDKVGDLLVSGGVGILVLDVQAMSEAGRLFITRIKQQFPDLVIVAAGARDAESDLARLISDGTIFRFIHKPMSPARAGLFAEAAVRRYEELRKRTGAAASRAAQPARSGGLLVAGGCAMLCAIAGGLWALNRGDRASSGPAAADGAAAGTDTPYAAAPALPDEPGAPVASADTDARSALAASRGRLLAQAQRALLEERLDEATAAIEAARRAGAQSGPLAMLAAELIKARAQVKGAGAPQAGAAPPPAERLAALAMQRIQEGRLIDAQGDSARSYVQQALAADPNSGAADRASQALALGLLSAARGAIDRQDFAAAADWLAAADGIASATNVDNLRRQLAAAQRPASAADAPAQPAEQRPGEGSPAVPAEEFASGAAAREPSSTGRVDANQLTLVKSVQPEYPHNAREGSIEGWVEVDFTVAESGELKDLSVHAASPRGVFDRAAINALSQWRYQPVLVDSKPVAQRARIRIRFALAH